MVALDGHVNGVNGVAPSDSSAKSYLKNVNGDEDVGSVDVCYFISFPSFEGCPYIVFRCPNYR